MTALTSGNGGVPLEHVAVRAIAGAIAEPARWGE